MATRVQLILRDKDDVIELTLPNKYKSEQFMDDFITTLEDAVEVKRAQYIIEGEE